MLSTCLGETLRLRSLSIGAACAATAVLALSGCTLAEQVGSGSSAPPGASETSASETAGATGATGATGAPVVPVTPAPTVFPLPDGLTGDAAACLGANAATDAMFALAKNGAGFNDDSAVKVQFALAVDQLLASRDAAAPDQAVHSAIDDLVFAFTGRVPDRDDWLMWDSAKGHAADPDSGAIEDALDVADDACDDVGYDWVDWESNA